MFKKFKEWKNEICFVSPHVEDAKLTNGNVVVLIFESIVGIVTIGTIAFIAVGWVIERIVDFIDSFRRSKSKSEEEAK